MAAKSQALKFVLFLGTVRENNYGSRAAKFMVNKLQSKGHDVCLLDPEVLDLPLLKKPLHFYQNRSDAPKVLQDTVKHIEAADAFVVITAEYNHSMPPALTNMMDHFPIPAYRWRPTGIVSYSAGGFAGVRAAMQVRCFMGELGSPTVGTLFPIPQIQKVLAEDGSLVDGENKERLNKSADKLITELTWYTEAIKKQRDSVGHPNL